MNAMRDLFLAELGTEIDVNDFSRTCSIVRLEPDRAGSDIIVGYRVGDTTIIRAEPDHGPLVAPLNRDDEALDYDALRAWAIEHGWEEFDGNHTHVLEDGRFVPAPTPDGLTLVRLDAETDGDEIRAFLASNDPEDVEAADFEPDELDPYIVGLLDTDGTLVGVASAVEWEEGSAFGDIGIVIGDALRGRGAGKALTTGLLSMLDDAGVKPLYRCNWTRPVSRKLALSLGFEQVLELIAFRPANTP